MAKNQSSESITIRCPSQIVDSIEQQVKPIIYEQDGTAIIAINILSRLQWRVGLVILF
jgi:hypothetical protein